MDATNCEKDTPPENAPTARHTTYLKTLSKDEKQKFLDSFDVVFCDCDGVIWHTMRDVIPGSPAAIDYLRQQGKQVKFVTNNSIVSLEEHLAKFRRFNLSVTKCDIVHPAQSVCDYLRALHFEGLIFCIASSPFKALLRDAGFQLVDEKDRIIRESVDDLRAAIYTREPVKAVVIDVDFNLTAAKLMRAHVHLKDRDCMFIGGAADTLIPFGGGDVIGPGPFIEVVEKTSRRQATILGKPGRALCRMLNERYRADGNPGRALFIGDSIASDVQFGRMCGFQTLLVLSGGTSARDLDEHDFAAGGRPDYIVDCLGDLNGLV